MKVLVLNNVAPFIRGGAELLADNLVRRLNAVRGVSAELVRMPFRWDPPDRLVEEILLNRLIKLQNVDRVIGLKFPAYLVPHPDKSLWIFHQFRQAYDLYREGQTNIPLDDQGRKLVAVVREADNRCFESCRQIFTNSPVTKDRLERYNGVESTVLYPPPLDPELFECRDYRDYVFFGGRIGPGKRQHLLIEAMRFVKSTGKLVIAGPADTPDYADWLRRLRAQYELEDRVELQVGFQPRDVIAEYVNNSLACVSIPIDEDSMSYVALEAFCASKAVLTCTDSGGVLEIVKDGQTGIVASPDVHELAQALERLMANPERTKALGRQAHALWKDKALNWDTVVHALLD